MPDAAPARTGRPVAVGMVLAAAASLQVGAAFAVTLFDELGPARCGVPPAGVRRGRAVGDWRPSLAGDLRLAGASGLALGLMNWSIYEAMDRIPLGVAVTIESAGPLLVAVIGSHRMLDGVWIVLAAAGILLLADPGGQALGARELVAIAWSWSPAPARLA